MANPQNSIQKAQNERGQLSVFLGISMVVVITMLAFIVNVGLFVKAKINLQNAVDAAAFSGAATQARYLTNMSYLNWEMRNTYKEWMFKYYILGQLGLDNTISPKVDSADKMNFRLQPFYRPSDGTPPYDPNVFDKYNLPSICIHYGSEHNICEIVSIPGLPRFNTVGLPNISEHHETFLNAIVATKSEDCSSRSDVNFGTSMIWAFGTGNGQLFTDVPQIAADRVGAWPQAFELALRMRNLEAIVNTPPVTEGICLSGDGCVSIESLEGISPDYPLYERPVKAFWSAWKNLSGGDLKRDGGSGDALSSTFKLTELEPNAVSVDDLGLSGYLIPSGKTDPRSGTSALIKSYIDLQVYPINFATFFTTFVSTTTNFQNSGTPSEADCGGSKTALPVPGYLFGFSKNPKVLTYYAVKGEADYIGLFFPFTEQGGIKLKTYAAAKPFGGKIGPKLFNVRDGRTVVTRSPNLRSSSYVSALDTFGLPNDFQPGYPIPWDSNFWAKDGDAFGGTPGAGTDVKFVVPNLIYDFSDIGEIMAQQTAGDRIQKLERATNEFGSRNIREEKGLFDGEQFRRFKGNMTNPSNVVLSADEINKSLDKIRRPTRYEAMNYLIPTLDNPDDFFDSPSAVVKDGRGNYRLYAPLFHPRALYNDAEEIKGIMADYINNIQASIDTYMDSMKKVADDMKAKSAGARDSSAYIAAANTIYTDDTTVSGAVGDPSCEKIPMASKFNHFFTGGGDECGIRPLKDMMVEYFSGNINPSYYYAPYEDLDQSIVTPSDLRAAYMPGPRQGALADGLHNNPYTPAEVLGRRNYYSTKLVAIEKLVQTGGNHQFGEGIPNYLERGGGNTTGPADAELQDKAVVNTLKTEELSEFGQLFY